MTQKFGGQWTEDKLDRLEKYLKAYLTIFTSNERASKFTRHYVDAFAGSGSRDIRKNGDELAFEEAQESVEFMQGSVHRALALPQGFHRYHLIEENPAHAEQLKAMIRSNFPDKADTCDIRSEDANTFLSSWASTLQWNDRAVVFLDPYGMTVKWETIERLAATEKVDLWMLFPSSSVIRMLPRQGQPSEAWSRKLTEIFGTNAWQEHFYPEDPQADMFNEGRRTREVTEQTVAEYILRRLRESFAGVVDKPLVLYNSKRSPLYMLVFAASNPKGTRAALNIANDIIRKP